MNSEQIKSLLAGVILSILGGVAAKWGLDAATTQTLAVGIASGIIIVATIVWRVASKSNNAIVAQAAQVIAPTGGVILTTPDVANGALKDVPNVQTKPGT